MNNEIRIHISGDIFKLIATSCTLNSQEILKRPNDQGKGDNGNVFQQRDGCELQMGRVLFKQITIKHKGR